MVAGEGAVLWRKRHKDGTIRGLAAWTRFHECGSSAGMTLPGHPTSRSSTQAASVRPAGAVSLPAERNGGMVVGEGARPSG
jgi:hypothetical protein